VRNGQNLVNLEDRFEAIIFAKSVLVLLENTFVSLQIHMSVMGSTCTKLFTINFDRAKHFVQAHLAVRAVSYLVFENIQ